MTDPTPTANVQAILDAYSTRDADIYENQGTQIESLQLFNDAPDGNAIVICNSQNPDTDPIVIVNPPVLMRDTNGDIEIDGVMYTNDPLGAVAQVIRNYGG